MNKLKQFLTARRISLGLILVLVFLMFVSTRIPQEIDSTPAKIETWRRSHEGLLWLVDGVNLHGIYAQPWFAAMILFAALTLCISSYDQLAVARRKLSANGITSSADVASSITSEKLHSVARMYRYLALTSGTGGVLKFVRNPWGYFGVLLLHIGITIVLIGSLFVSLTGRQGVLIMVEGELRDNPQPWNASEHGIMAAPLESPGSIQLDKVSVRFDNKNQPVDVLSDISIADQTGKRESITAAVNRICWYKGLRIYHSSQYGDAFTVIFTDRSGMEYTEKISAQQPVNLESAGYSDDFNVTWSPFQFGVKYFADADKKSMSSGNPQLVLRMLNGKNEIARTVLTTGNSGMLGEYRVQLIKVERWAKLIIVDINGMSVIFAGFAIIMLGGLIHYMTPPRELIGVIQPDGLYRVYWKVIAFKEFFGDEYDDIACELNRGGML